MIIKPFCFLLFACFVTFTVARYCVHNEKSWCRGHEIWGWCFHNKTSGIFDCDDDGFCVSQDQLKNKKSSGCFVRGNSSVCCCNDADGCNLGFIGIQPKYAHGQQCSNTAEIPNEDVKTFKPCDDPYCYSVLSAEEDGGPTTAYRGCHSRKMVMHHMAKNEDEKYQNNTKWRESDQLAKLPSCADILAEQPKVNGTRSLCVDFGYEQEDDDGEMIQMKGRLCCCDGTNRCNEKAMWADEGIPVAELEEEIKKRKVVKSVSAGVFHSIHVLSMLIASLCFF